MFLVTKCRGCYLAFLFEINLYCRCINFIRCTNQYEKLFPVPDVGGIYNCRGEPFCEPAFLYEDHAAMAALPCHAGSSEWRVRDSGGIVVIAGGNKGSRCMVYYSTAHCCFSGECADDDELCPAAQSLFVGDDREAATAGGAGVVGVAVCVIS